MTHLLAIAAGGAIGAVLRYLMSNGIHMIVGKEFPYGTLAVNVLGSLIMGFLMVLLIDRMDVSSVVRAFMTVGLLGAFTTFSTFSMETLNLIEKGELTLATINVAASVILCVVAAAAGVLAGRQM